MATNTTTGMPPADQTVTTTDPSNARDSGTLLRSEDRTQRPADDAEDLTSMDSNGPVSGIGNAGQTTPGKSDEAAGSESAGSNK